ncbi:MAG TPA: HAMP domain-containing protein [Tepidimicrobium sp.]|nr:HAMP domain-containing protein [Tepidimicrobium sp.]
MKLSKKLTLSFVLVILFSIFIISLISNTMISNRFDTYLIEEQEKRFEIIRKDINNLFIERNRNLTNDDIASYADREGIYIEIRDLNNNMVCHSNNHSRGLRYGIMGHMKRHHRMMGHNLDNRGNYIEKTFPLISDDREAATLVIGYIDNSHLTESALIFKNTLYRSFIISGLITTLFGVMISVLLARGLSRPLLNITNTANEIRKGNMQSRVLIRSNTKEIVELSNSINYLGEALEKQENLRKRYASDIAHELRTPLTTLKSHVEAMIDRVWKPDEENLNILLAEIHELNKLVDDLKNSFQTLEGQMNMNKTLFDISSEIKDIISTFKPIFEKNRYALEYAIEKNIEITMDRDRFRQIIYNLLSNSIKYLDDNGKVFVSLDRVDDNIRITIEDNGVGIEKKDLPLIFERFYRSDTSRNRKTGGTGLGLSITKTLIEAHKGSIFVDSTLGKGTKFTILLPIDTSNY